MLKLVIINIYSGPIKSSIDNKLRDIRKSYRVKAKLSSAGYIEKEGTHQGGPKTTGIVPRDSDSQSIRTGVSNGFLGEYQAKLFLKIMF